MEMFFTVKTANRALSLVRPIVDDILRKMREAEGIHRDVKKEKASAVESKCEPEYLIDKLNQVEKLLNEVEYHMKELQGVGVVLKDMQQGFVDFPCQARGRTVHLCWMPSEEFVRFWHEEGEGIEERKLIDQEFVGTAVS